MVINERIDLQTKGNADVLDITPQINQIVAKGDLICGIATIFTASSTSAITTLEFESGCVSDLRRLFDEIIDPGRHYAHNARWGDGNGHSHVRAALLRPSITIPIVDGKLTLGTWQQVIFIDFDNRPRKRSIIVQLMGD